MVAEGLRLESFVQKFSTQEFKDTHVSRILQEITGQEGNVEAIADRYNASNSEQKANLHSCLVDVDHWDWRVTTAGIEIICNHFLNGIDPNNLRLLQMFFGKIVLALSRLCEPRVLHLGFFGGPGVGKSTCAVQIVQAVLLGRFEAGVNESLKKQMGCQRYEDERLQAMASIELTGSYIYINCTDRMTPAALQGEVKEQTKSSGGLITIYHYDEVDKLGVMMPAVRREFMGKFQLLVQGDITNKQWFPKGTPPDERVAPYISVHIWSGNLGWGQRASHLQARNELHHALKEIVKSKKFESSRMPEVSHIIPLS
jgi:hypothetical protein